MEIKKSKSLKTRGYDLTLVLGNQDENLTLPSNISSIVGICFSQAMTTRAGAPDALFTLTYGNYQFITRMTCLTYESTDQRLYVPLNIPIEAGNQLLDLEFAVFTAPALQVVFQLIYI